MSVVGAAAARVGTSLLPDLCGISCIERIRLDDVVRIKADYKVLRLCLAERAVVVDAICPGRLAIIDSYPPGSAEHGLDLRLGRFPYLNIVYFRCGKITPDGRAGGKGQ